VNNLNAITVVCVEVRRLTANLCNKGMFPCFSRKNQARMGFCSGVAMSVNIKLSENLVAEARRYAQAQHRSVPKQIEYWSRIGKIAEENPDLPFAMIRDILIAEQEEATSEYRFG
jgi:hypothetical protein